jgi:hypothetical protein
VSPASNAARKLSRNPPEPPVVTTTSSALTVASPYRRRWWPAIASRSSGTPSEPE